MTEPVAIVRAGTVEDLRHIRMLFVEYHKWLGIDLCFQSFKEELESLPGKYAPPAGCLLLGRVEDTVVGGVGMRPMDTGICEMKRLFIRQKWRGQGYGRRLAEAIIKEAREAGYAKMRLDTLARLMEALELYGSMGFVEIPPYYHNPHENVVFLELDLVAD